LTSEILIVAVLPLLLALAAGWDIASFTIPNFIPLAVLASFAAFAIATGLTPGEIGSHLLAGTIGLSAGFALFALGYIGGGDAKLFASVLVWLGFRDMLGYIVVASLMGGALTLALIALRAVPLPALFYRQQWIAKLHNRASGIPYGVALALGGFAVLPYTEIFRLAAVV
jgi:prepilin peptidase CpaA